MVNGAASADDDDSGSPREDASAGLRRLRYLRRMRGGQLSAAIVFVDDAADLEPEPEPGKEHTPTDATSRSSDDEKEEEGEEEDAELGATRHFHRSGAGAALATACRTTDYHRPALEAQLLQVWSHAAASDERLDGSGSGWPMQTGDWWCTAHANLHRCAATPPPPAPAPRGRSGIRRSTAKRESVDVEAACAPHLVFQVLVRAADLRLRPIGAVARICAAVRAVVAWCVRSGTVGSLLLPASLPSSGAGLASLTASAAATEPFEVLGALVDELSRLRPEATTEGCAVHTVVLAAGGAFASQAKQAEHRDLCAKTAAKCAKALGGESADG